MTHDSAATEKERIKTREKQIKENRGDLRSQLVCEPNHSNITQGNLSCSGVVNRPVTVLPSPMLQH